MPPMPSSAKHNPGTTTLPIGVIMLALLMAMILAPRIGWAQDVPRAKSAETGSTTFKHVERIAVDTADKSKDAVPEGLTDSAWKGIRQAYEQHRHAAVAVDGEFRARNPGQQWLTHFDGRGFIVKPDAAGWRWGLQLQSYGFPGHQRTVNGQAKMTAKDDRVTYNWQDGLQEWFVNDRSGLEHGFTISSRPPGSGDSQLDTSNPQMVSGDRLELCLAVRGSLRVKGQADGQGVSFVNQQGSTVVNYAGLKVWDADHRLLPARIEAETTELLLTVDEHGAHYPLTIDPIAQQEAYLKASNTDAGDEFGFRVAVSGDTVVVGAFLEDSNAAGVNGDQADNSAVESGAAYVFLVPQDCNENGIDDRDDIAQGTSEDCDNNGVPDECEPELDSDTDNDGLRDACDACPDSDLSNTIAIESCNSDVSNDLFDDGCTMADLLAECVINATNNDQIFSCMSQLSSDWRASGLISGKEFLRIVFCVNQLYGDVFLERVHPPSRRIKR